MGFLFYIIIANARQKLHIAIKLAWTMNIYQRLNQLTLHIENHLDSKIDYNTLAEMLDTNTYTMQRIFSALVGIPLAEYIRRRRLSNAACDLLTKNWRIIDLAAKYNYNSSIAFSRAFTNFHGIKPSQVKLDAKLQNFARPIFNETVGQSPHTEYTVIERPAFRLYGVYTVTNTQHIGRDAPRFFEETAAKYQADFGFPDFGMVAYRDPEREECSAYYVLYDHEIPGFELVNFPASKWLKFITKSYKPNEIQKTSNDFYADFLPSSNYQLADLPELEYYHDGITELWVPIISD